jgi:hypothetical protein
MTDPVTASIMVILGRYALDMGTELAREVGPAAARKAGELFRTALDYLRRDPAGQVVAEEFKQDPATYEKPVERKLKEAVQADGHLATQLQELLAQYQEAVQAHAAAAGTAYRGTVRGSGALAQGPGASAVGEGGVSVGGNVQGPIITGSGNVIHAGRAPDSSVTLPPTLAPLRDKLTRHFTKGELKTVCFDLGVAHDDLPADTRTELAQALVEYCYLRGRLPELVRRCREERPHVHWD